VLRDKLAPQIDVPFTIDVTAAVISSETNDLRFENFCRAVVSKIEGGALIFPTSHSWDLGRDGVGAGRASGLYICVSLRDDVDAKALSDIQRLQETTHSISRVFFCSCHALSEHRISKIETVLSDEVDHAFPIKCYGVTQLIAAAREFAPDIIETNYGAEIANTLRAIRPDLSGETEIKGLRLALISAAADDSASIRSEVYKNGILDVLNDGKKRTIANLAKDFSEALRLQRNIAHSALRPHLQDLVDQGKIFRDTTSFWITDKGQTDIQSREKDATTRLLSGRQAIKDSLTGALGIALIDDHFNRIWAVFEEKMAHYFIARGDAIVNEISELLGDVDSTNASSPQASPLSFLDDLADAVAATSSHAQQQEELRQAVRDLFTDRTSIATNWLVKLCASFVAACALGLEHSSSAALQKLLSKTTLVLDTDVLLSLLGEGEPEHDSVVTVVDRWKALGGSILAADPVLEEVAYHASISQADFDSVHHRLPGTAADRLHMIENVFVRSFAEMLSKKQIRTDQWKSYISQFRGGDKRDHSVVFGHISSEHGIGKLPPRSTQESELEDRVREYLVHGMEDKYSGDELRNMRDKARRDAELYSALVHRLRIVKAADPGATCLLVSSAKRLARTEAHFHQSGEQQFVVSVSAVVLLISALPDVSLGLSAMKSFLFDERRRGFSSGLERTLVRIIQSSREFSMPWAKRGVLMRRVRSKLIEDAHAQGDRNVSSAQLADLEKEALRPENEKKTIAMLSDALDAVAVDAKTAKENAELRRKVQELEAKLAARPPAPSPRPKRR